MSESDDVMSESDDDVTSQNEDGVMSESDDDVTSDDISKIDEVMNTADIMNNGLEYEELQFEHLDEENSEQK